MVEDEDLVEDLEKAEEKQNVETEFIDEPWRRKWQPTPVFLPGESHGRRSRTEEGAPP